MKSSRQNPEEAVKQRTLVLLKEAGEHFKLRLEPVEIRFDLSGQAAGMVRFAPPGVPVIRYNRVLLEKYHDSFIKQTVPHEVAHVVVAALYPNRTAPHGPEWRLMMGFFNAEPKRCHNYRIERSSTRRLAHFNYLCGCRQHRITSIRHNRINRGQRYICRHCGKFLKLAR